MSLKIVSLPDTRMFWLSGTVNGERIRESTRTDVRELAEEKRAVREAEAYRAGIHGLAASRPFAEVAYHYLKRPRSDDVRKRVGRFLRFLKTEDLTGIRCSSVNQELLDRACEKMLRPRSSDSTRLREVVSPARAVLNFGAVRGWCLAPAFEVIRQPRGRTEWLTPGEAEAVISRSPPNLAATFAFMFSCGPRRGEVLSLNWKSVMLDHGRATFRDIKGKLGDKWDRRVDLVPRGTAALAWLARTADDGPVFRQADGSEWHPDSRVSGARLNREFQDLAAWAGIDRHVHLHMIRHSWASWHYAVHRNVKLLMHEGAWDSMQSVDRYTHLIPEGMVADIKRFWASDATPHSQNREEFDF